MKAAIVKRKILVAAVQNLLPYDQVPGVRALLTD